MCGLLRQASCFIFVTCQSQGMVVLAGISARKGEYYTNHGEEADTVIFLEIRFVTDNVNQFFYVGSTVTSFLAS